MVLPWLFPLVEGVAFGVAVAFVSRSSGSSFAFESLVDTASGSTHHLFDLGDHDSSCKLPAWPSSLAARSAGRRGAHSRSRSCGPQDDSSYPAYEPVPDTSASSSASRTYAPPACVPPSLWPPRDVSWRPNDGTDGVKLHRHGRRFALPGSAAGA